MKEIKLSRGMVALVDNEDFEWLSAWKWACMPRYKNGYAIRSKQGKTIYMHRLLMGPALNRIIHHKNGNGLDNRRCNLVEMTEREHSRLPHKTLKQGRRPKRRLT